MPIADRWRQAGLKACATGVIVASALAAPAVPTARRTFRNCTDRTRRRHRPPNGVPDQPARPRCQGATPFLANPGGPPRRDAVGVRDPRGGQRTGSRAQGRRALGLRTRRLRSVHRRRLRGPGAPVVATLLLAGPRLGRDGRCLRVERDRMVGDGAAGAVRLDRAVDRTGERARSVGAIAIAPVAARVHGRRRRRLGARLRHEPRAVRALSQRTPRRRSALHAGLDQLQQPPAVPDLRRHDAAEERAERRWRHSRQRLVSRRDRLPRQAQRLWRQGRAARADRRDARRRTAPGDHERRQVDLGHRADSGLGGVPRRDVRRAPGASGMGGARVRRDGLDTGLDRQRVARAAGCARRSAGSAHRE